MTEEQARFFYDNAMYGMLIDFRPTQAAVLAWEAAESGSEVPLLKAMDKLELLEQETLKAEFYPFENWYRETWIRRRPRFYNIHYSYHKLRAYLER
ncbi:hypothetical protein [Pontiella agarivorans]|uniref:Uncharacterized protein n=1 Tax=Pontiella agarivorans TaxID=3038953 RepID=A0ABU5MSD2_9BACT|nr:hypothetical protein [Pontiella agarivorans]MDZ8117028.1 hypothetical protein [Pontiella agarivorans]